MTMHTRISSIRRAIASISTEAAASAALLRDQNHAPEVLRGRDATANQAVTKPAPRGEAL